MTRLNRINDKLSDTSSLLDKTVVGMIEGLTGIAASDRRELSLSAGHLFQRYRIVGFLNALMDEWDKFREKGKIKDDYMRTEQHKACLGELLEALDRENVDNVRFDLLKKIFLVASTESKSNRESVLPQQYMALARQLSSGEVIVLLTAYRIVKERKFGEQDLNYDNAIVRIANESGLSHKELVRIHENTLAEKALFIRRHEIVSSTSDNRGHFYKFFLLTNLGWALCEFVDGYDTKMAN